MLGNWLYLSTPDRYSIFCLPFRSTHPSQHFSPSHLLTQIMIIMFHQSQFKLFRKALSLLLQQQKERRKKNKCGRGQAVNTQRICNKCMFVLLSVNYFLLNICNSLINTLRPQLFLPRISFCALHHVRIILLLSFRTRLSLT